MAITVTNYGNVIQNSTPYFNLIDNYVYLHHTQTLIVLPTFPESIIDSMPASYTSTPIMGRSAPIYSYSGSGPRSIDLSFKLHRDMMNQVNTDISIPDISDASILNSYQALQKKLARKDYMELLINELQSIAFPNYAAAEKMINPPMVSVRIGDEIFCKGVVNGGVNVTYSGPILNNPLYDENGEYIYEEDIYGKPLTIRKSGKGKYAVADVNFKVSEIDPYDALTIARMGSLRGYNRNLEKNLYLK